MALNAYLKLIGQKTGEIKGPVTQKGREGSIEIIAVSHEIVSPRDAQSGLATGRRMHKPFVITKESDKTSPLLYNMLCTNELFKQWTLQFWAAGLRSGTGVEVQSHSVQLTNASIANIAFRLPNTKNPELVRYMEYEEIAFTYQSITWTWNDGDIKASDDWEQRT